jgi:hypothetical protein
MMDPHCYKSSCTNNNDNSFKMTTNDDDTAVAATTQPHAEGSIGSGLVLFFRDFLRKESTIESCYFTSLSEMQPVQQPQPQIDNNNSLKVIDGHDDVDMNKDQELVADTVKLTYAEWRMYTKKFLTNFLVPRLNLEQEQEGRENDEDDESEDDSSVDDDDDDDQQQEEDKDEYDMEETQPESQSFFETQPPLFETQDFPSALAAVEEEFEGRPNKRRKRSSNKRRQKNRKQRQRIPRVSDTLHEVSKLEYLDLYTQTFHIPLGRIVKVWKLRDTKRGLSTRSNPSEFQKKCQIIASKEEDNDPYAIFPRIVFDNMEDDGPLATAYKSVLSMEVEQLKVNIASTTAAIDTTSTTARQQPQLNIKIFLYDEYAEQISQWIDDFHQRNNNEKKNQQDSNIDFIMNLSNVPAKCIFPYVIPSTDWVHQKNMVPYCVCIGGQSGVRLRTEEGIHERAFFDTDDLGIRMATVGGSPHDELTLSRHQRQQQEQQLTNVRRRSSGTSAFLSSSEEPTTPLVGDVGSTGNYAVKLEDIWTLYTQQARSSYTEDDEHVAAGYEPISIEQQHQLLQPLQRRQTQRGEYSKIATGMTIGQTQIDQLAMTENQRLSNECTTVVAMGTATEQTVEATQLAAECIPEKPQKTVQPMTFEGDATRQQNLNPVRYEKLVSGCMNFEEISY